MILIVDSEKVPDLKIKRCFDEYGIKLIEVVKTAEKARSFLKLNAEEKNNKISLIIINSELEDASGFDLCQEIKRTVTGKSAFIMMLISSNENKTAIEKARHSGADDYIVKPYGSAEFSKRFTIYMKKKVVLLVDDDPVIRQIVRAILIRSNLEVIEVEDGIQANNLLNSLMPTRFVLLDIGLPSINGIQLVAKIRRNTQWSKVPIVMITGSTDVADVKASLAAGANDYIAKPIKPDEFTTRISRYMPDES